MIKLIRGDGKPIWVNPNKIFYFVPGTRNETEGTWIDTGIPEEQKFVTETPEEVARKVLEWWFNMNWLKQGGGVYARAELERLTGLKEKPNSYWQRVDGYRYETGTRVDGGTEP